jgi:hypothetical protein
MAAGYLVGDLIIGRSPRRSFPAHPNLNATLDAALAAGNLTAGHPPAALS